MKQIYTLLAAMWLHSMLISQPVSQTIPTDTSALHSLKEVVVSANRFDQQRKNIPQPTEVIRAQQLAFDNQLTSADVLQLTGNVFMQKSQLGGGSPVIRGFETNKVLLVVDGIRMNNAIYRAGHLQNIVTLDNAVMSRIEILYGPGSVMYGSDALGGVMHFYSKNPILSSGSEKEIHANAFARYSTAAEEKTGHLDFSIGGTKFGSLTSFTYSDFGDLKQGAQRRDEYPDFGKRPSYQERPYGEDVEVVNDDPDVQVGSGYTQYDFLQKFVYQASEAVAHKINFQYSTSSDVPRYDRLTQFRDGTLRYGDWYYGPQKRLLGSYTMALNRSEGLLGKGNVIVGYQNIEESRHDRNFGSSNLNHRIEQLDIITLNADFAKQKGASAWSYGLEGTYNDVNSTANRENISTGVSTPLDTRYPNGGSSVSSAALYVSNSYSMNPNFILQGGMRLAYHTLTSKFDDKTFFPFPYDEVTQNNTVLTGSLGSVLQVESGWRVSAQLATGFRTPSVDDMSKVFESVPGSLIVPNPDLGPEHTLNADLTLSKSMNDKYEVGVGGYYTWYRDAITTQPGTFNGQSIIVYDGDSSQVITNVNARKAFIYGMNAYLSINFTSKLSLYSTINYTYGRIETDTTDYPLDHISPLYGKTSLRLNLDKFRGEVYAMYNGWKHLEDYNLVGEDNIAYATEDGMPAWMTLNLRGEYRLTDHFMVQAGIENILDTNYRVFSSNISSPGRNISVALRGTF